MKKKILFIALMTAVLVFVLALCVGARTNYREEQTYNYYDKDGNLLYNAVTIYAVDTDKTYGGTFRYEGTIREGEMKFAKVDGDGNPLTWYVVNDDKDSNGDRVQNITVASVQTSTIGTIDTNGLFTFNNTVIDGITVNADNIVSINFFGMNISTFPQAMFMADAESTPDGSTKEYCQMANGTYLLALYLPKTLTSIPDQFCQRSSVRVLEFEDNMITGEFSITTKKIKDSNGQEVEGGPFAYCANLKAISIPEGITAISSKAFRECLSISYIKLPSTMTKVEADTFWRGALNLHTYIIGENITSAQPINKMYARFYFGENNKENINMKYMVVPSTINASGPFDSYRGANEGTSLGFVDVNKSITFFLVGTLEDAERISAFTDRHFTSAFKGLTSAKNSTTPGEQPVDYYTYLENIEYYSSLPDDRHLLVYNVPRCVAYYDGVHDVQDDGDCTTALVCNRCGTEVESSSNSHDNQTVVNYPKGFLNDGYVRVGCTKCSEYEEEKLSPMFICLGYSSNENGGNGFALGFRVNAEAISKYKELTSKTVEYGLFAGSVAVLNGNDVIDAQGNGADGVIMANTSEFGNVIFELKITGFADETQKEAGLVLGAYVIERDESDSLTVSYLQEKEPNQGEKYSTETYNSIIAK